MGLTKALTISTWNANGIRNKLGELSNFLAKQKIDIMLINEIKIKETDQLKIRHYTTIKKCRHNAAGGVAILIRQNIPHSIIRPDYTTAIEYVGITLENKVTIIAVYNNPRTYIEESDIEHLTKIGDKVLLIGDLNARHRAWNCQAANINGKAVHKYTQKTNYIILHTQEPTHYPPNGSTPSIIDIALNKNVQHISHPKVTHDLN